jgi:hypothetical protein
MEECIYSWVVCAHEDAGWPVLEEIMRITVNQGLLMHFNQGMHVSK